VKGLIARLVTPTLAQASYGRNPDEPISVGYAVGNMTRAHSPPSRESSREIDPP